MATPPPPEQILAEIERRIAKRLADAEQLGADGRKKKRAIAAELTNLRGWIKAGGGMPLTVNPSADD